MYAWSRGHRPEKGDAGVGFASRRRRRRADAVAPGCPSNCLIPPAVSVDVPAHHAGRRRRGRRGDVLRPGWVERWDVAFADLYLRAHDAFVIGESSAVPRPWRLAFTAPDDLPALRHVLLGINAHVNYDLPQAMLSVISPADFDDVSLTRRADAVTTKESTTYWPAASRHEDDLLGDPKTLLDRLLAPLNRVGSKRFLREARQKVWHNVQELNAARLDGDRATSRASVNSKCSAPPASPTCSRQDRCCCGWPSPASVSRSRPRRHTRNRSSSRVSLTGSYALTSPSSIICWKC